MMKLHPAPGYVLVKVLPEEKTTLHIANQKEEDIKKATVIEVGKPLLTDFNALIESPVKKGETILHSTIGYEEVEIEYEKYRLIKFQAIIGIYE